MHVGEDVSSARVVPADKSIDYIYIQYIFPRAITYRLSLLSGHAHVQPYRPCNGPHITHTQK